ncbi:hypothetical protein ACLVWU_11020 [Bdellovibrio sp. HCB290]|uniref:hypothetical protein n=1 Tax=Bdellovibrio sp. HCB290 TaxID=3394356 RepID=UPI0039B3661F
MKSAVIALTLLFASVSFANERVFDCAVTQLNKNAEIPAELDLKNNPQVLFRHGLKQWSLQVGGLKLDTRDLTGPALWLDVDSTPSSVEYIFSVEGSTEFELSVNVKDHSAQLYYWGLGEKTTVGSFACEVIEQ